MNEAFFVTGRAARLTGFVVVMAAVSACSEESQLSFLQPKDTGDAEMAISTESNATTKLVERDVEAPDVFAVTEAGLWDGRPSLGGVWVAHPDVADPERVIIRNETNGKFVIGALFRRERDIPGPRLQASSDAASALGMLAGAPVQLNVTALRREEVAPKGEPAKAPASAGTMPEATAVAATTLDPIAGAAVAIEASEPTSASGDTVVAAEETVVIAEETTQPAKKSWFGAGLFAKKSTEATEPEAIELASADTVSSASDVLVAVEEPKPAKQPLFAGGLFGKKNKDVGEPLNALAPQPVSATAIDAAPIPTASATPASAARKSPLSKPYIQIGIFSVESNAETAADQMRGAGMVPTVFEQSTSGKAFWRVVVGPAQSKSEQSSLLSKIKGVGFTDAYAVTN